MMALASDITRCHDASCPSRGRCLRWIERETGCSHASSLRVNGGCSSFIHPGPTESPIPVPDYIKPGHEDAYRRGYLEGWIKAANDAALEAEGDGDGQI